MPGGRWRGWSPEGGRKPVVGDGDGPAAGRVRVGNADECCAVGDEGGGPVENEVKVGKRDGEAAAGVEREVTALSCVGSAHEVQPVLKPEADNTSKVWAAVQVGCREPAGRTTAPPSWLQTVELRDCPRPGDRFGVLRIEVGRLDQRNVLTD